MLVVDTGPLVTMANAREPIHLALRDLIRSEPGEVILPAPIAAEVDYLLHQVPDPKVRRSFVNDLAAGDYLVECLTLAEYDILRRYDLQYKDLDVGLADLSIVILANRFKTNRILTFDQRHFRALRPLEGGSFTLLPYDA